jgi:hypothetical protein
MPLVRTTITVAGFKDEEILPGLDDFRAEFNERKWIKNPRSQWDAERNLLVVTVEYYGDDVKFSSENALDEIRDCVIAYFNFSSDKITFDIPEATLIPIAGESVDPSLVQFAIYREFLDENGLWNPRHEGPYDGGLQISINASSEGYRQLAAYFQRLADVDTSNDNNYHEHSEPLFSVDGKTRLHLTCRKDDPNMSPKKQ